MIFMALMAERPAYGLRIEGGEVFSLDGIHWTLDFGFAG